MDNITATQFQTLQTTAIVQSGSQYDLNDYNCTDFGLDVINSIRPTNPIAFPDWVTPAGINYGRTPNGLYYQLIAMGNTPTNTYYQAPTGHAPCP